MTGHAMHPINQQNSQTQKIGLAIVAPGGYAPDDGALENAISMLEAQGCCVHNYYESERKYQRFAATDTARAAQLMAAAVNPEVHIVIALRGSYGMSRILPALDFKKLTASGKLFVGYSDFTAFNLGLLAQTGAISFTGPMICDDFTRPDLSQFTHQNFWQCLNGPTHKISAQSDNNPVLDVSGILWGGNLTMLTHLIGTPYFPQIDDGILFVEDVGEHPYRIERMLLQLLHAGVLGRQQAVLLGDFSQYRLGQYDNGYDFDSMLSFLRGYLPVPVLTGLPFGHIPDKATLPIGCIAHLTSQKTSFQLRMSGYPTLLSADENR